MKNTFIFPTLLACLLAPQATAATITVTNGDFETGANFSSALTATNPLTTGWNSSTLSAPGNYGETMPGLTGRQAGFHGRGGNSLETGLTTSDMGAMDATTFGSFDITFDYGYRRDTATAGDIDFEISLWNTTTNTQLAATILVITDPGVGANSLTNTTVQLSYDNSAQTSGDSLTLRFANNSVGPVGVEWQRTAILDNVSVESVPEPSSSALLGLGGLALILRRRK